MNIQLEEAIIINRPSKSIKSPYLADIKINDNIELAHSPSLGMCGLIINSLKVMVSCCNTEIIRKSKYTIELLEVNDKENSNSIYIGCNPLYGNKIFSYFLKLNTFKEFIDYNIEKAEIKILDSRLDFLLKNNNNEKCYVEVKCAPLVDYNEKLHNKNEKLTYPINIDINKYKYKYKRASIFPDGYKNNKNQCISDRAYKHLNTLIELKKKNYRVALVFIIQREDSKYFRPNYNKDKIYSLKLKEAFDKGVEIYAYKFKWSINNNIGNCDFLKSIPIIFNF